MVDEMPEKEDMDLSLVKGIHHVSMKACTDAEYTAAITFYRDILGLAVVRTWGNGILLETGAGYVEIFNNGDTPLEKGVIRHFAFAVKDVDLYTQRVRAAGYEVFMNPQDIVIPSVPAFSARIAFCYGPLGEEIEFFQEK